MSVLININTLQFTAQNYTTQNATIYPLISNTFYELC